jgi:hypothetical protein
MGGRGTFMGEFSSDLLEYLGSAIFCHDFSYLDDFARFHNNLGRRCPKTPSMDLMKFSKIVVAAVVAVAGAGTGVRAQSSTAQAETLFRQGKDLISKGKIAEACAAFDASQKLDPTIATLLNQASCREKNGQLATAWGLFLDAERQSRAAGDATTRQFHQVATDHAAKLEPRLSTLTITIPAENRVGGLEVLRDAEPVDAGAWNKALPVDGGTYKITARAPGNAEWSSTVTVAVDHDAKAIEIPKLKAAALQPSHDTRPAATAEVTGAPADGRRSRVLPIVVGGVAVGLLGGALGFELSARSSYDSSKKAKTNQDLNSEFDSAVNKRHVAEGLALGGLAAAGVSVWLFLRSSGSGGDETTSTSTQASRLIIQPVFGPDHAGLVVGGRY